ncbi:toll-like receptor 2 [Centruroides sculpturatus]|uniref:toll-like receptor 2 n=1 Tax=Centruroides sculpturatus TaxID=218467 RepID=UPI000C6E9AB6|nr:toll-like receptor 2 [Centruroides sculpturatus]XP_023211538.1 toll-like receptor 2 [Centruroides sculpturatus]
MVFNLWLILILFVLEIRQSYQIGKFLGPVNYLKSHSDIGKPFIKRFVNGCEIKLSSRKNVCSGQLCTKFPSECIKLNITWLALEETGIGKLDPFSFENFTLLKELFIVKNQIRILENYTFYNLNNLEYLNLGGNLIQTIEKYAFEGLKNLENLILIKNELTTITLLAEALVPTLSSLQILNIGPNQFAEIKKDDFNLLRQNKIKELDLMFCGINYIHPQAFNIFKNLEYLSLRMNERLSSKILCDLFSNMTDIVPLERLDLSGISDLNKDKNFFILLNKLRLKTLYMNAVEITDIKDEMFPNMDYLEELHMDKARVRKIGDYAFNPLKALKSLFLGRNVLSEITKGLLLPHLENLDLSGFPMSSLMLEIKDNIFMNMSSLKSLDLSYKIISIYRNTFAGLIKLEKLKLENCKMQFIELGSFTHLKSLKMLDMKNNQLFQTNSYSVQMFHGLVSLETLILNENKLNSIDSLFNRLFSLKYLDLNYNLIKNIKPENFFNLTNLQTLYLRGNILVEWKKKTFSRNKNMNFMDISKNKIKTISSSMLNDIKNLKQVNMSDNPFVCNCELLIYLNWANDTNTTIINYSVDEDAYICHVPIEFSNRKLISMHKTLLYDCKTKIKPALLGLLAILLFLLLTVVFAGYVYRRKLKNRPLNLDNNKEFIYDAFISYSTNDSDWVFNIFLPHLENRTNDLKLCVYDRDFVAGKGISECILDSIKCSRKTILIISNHFLQSRWCKFESDLAHHILVDEEREGLLLIKLEELDTKFITPHMNYLLKAKIHLSWNENLNEQEIFWKRLNDALVRPRSKKKRRSAII